VRWTEETCAATAGHLAHEIAWESQRGELLLTEQRRLSFEVHAAESYWTLDLALDLRNATAGPLALGSYESNHGLAGSFYTGLFWRIPREFLNRLQTRSLDVRGTMLCEGDLDSDEKMHGAPGRWVALNGSVDGPVAPVTLALIDRSAAGMSAPRVFIRKHMVGIALPFLGPASRTLAPAEDLRLRYRLLLADGHWDRARLAAYCTAAAAAGA
jgi:hypothetical protein